MKYKEFRDKVSRYPFFDKWTYDLISSDSKNLQNRVTEWTNKGYIIKLKRGLYTLNDDDRKFRLSDFYLANHLYKPSYISLESALSYYDLIPERVYEITSITSKKTQGFTNDFGRFTYAHIKQEVFSDYINLQDSYKNNFYIASKEKALLDFLYFRITKMRKIDKNIFEKSYRLQNLDDIDCRKLMAISKKFNQLKLTMLAKMLVEYIKEEWQ
jgi:predicted transcriptional regulator of viral defense system